MQVVAGSVLPAGVRKHGFVPVYISADYQPSKPYLA
ncbi:hypothetical protein M2371_002857 [Buttiauxella sp. BIGb0471]|nr:hypothetical protein [Buttiauxella sp. BIGb0471]